MSFTYALQPSTSTATSGSFVTALTLNVDTSADTGNSYYQLMYRYTLGKTGQFASQELRIRVDGAEVKRWNQYIDGSNVANDFMRISLTPGNHAVTFEHRLYSFTTGSTGSVSGTNMSLQRIGLI
jgi:hypothetical protein